MPIEFYTNGQAYDFLSNVSYAPVKMSLNGEVFSAPTSESIYQGLKGLGQSGQTDREAAEFIKKKRPGYGNLRTLIKSEVQQASLFHEYEKPFPPNQADFLLKEQIMYDILLAKATQNPAICKALLATNDNDPIFERAPDDKFWGNKIPENPSGKNKLGKAWERVRATLRREYNAGSIPVRVGLSPETARALGHTKPSPQTLPGYVLSKNDIDQTHLYSQNVFSETHPRVNIQDSAFSYNPPAPVPSAQLAARVAQTQQSSAALQTQSLGNVQSAQGLNAAQSQRPNTTAEIAGIKLKDLLLAMGKHIVTRKDSAPIQSGIFVLQVGDSKRNAEGETITSFEVTSREIVPSELKQSQEDSQKIQALPTKIRELNEKIKQAKSKVEVAANNFESDKQKYQDDEIKYRAEMNRITLIKNSNTVTLEEQSKNTRSNSVATSGATTRTRGMTVGFENEFNEAITHLGISDKGGLLPDKNPKEKPFGFLKNAIGYDVEDAHKVALNADATTIRKIIWHIQPETRKDPNLLSKIYDMDRETIAERIKKYHEMTAAAQASSAATPPGKLLKVPEEPKQPVPPTDDKLQQAQNDLKTMTDELATMEAELKKAQDRAASQTININDKKIGTITHDGGTVKVDIADPSDTQKVFSAIQGLKGEAKIKNPNRQNPEVATQMAIHSIITLQLVPKFDPPWTMSQPSELAPGQISKLQTLCLEVKKALDEHPFSDPGAKLAAQRDFDAFLDKNGIKLDSLKYKTTVEPAPAPGVTAEDQPLEFRGSRPP